MRWRRDKSEIARPRGIAEGQRVKLTLAHSGAIDARVEELSDSSAVLGLFREPDPPLTSVGAAEATLQVVTKSGVLRVTATVTPHNGEPDAVRAEFHPGTESVQRREYFRLDVMAPVVLSRANGARVETHTLDLAGAGCLLPKVENARLHERVHIAIDIGEDDPVRVAASVVRITEENHVGLQFESIREAERERLIRYLFRRQRSAARIARR